MKQGFIRIIGGKWRGRRIRVLDSLDLRPTPDRVRETLFNWLSPYITGATCLDMYSGSGALGFEALSRGADFVVMVDESQKIVQLLQEEIDLFKAMNADAYCAHLPKGLRSAPQLFDIVFIDPPYQKNLLFASCQFLEAHHFLASPAYIYLEAQQLIEDNELPRHWHIVKNKRAGHVYYHLAKREINETTSSDR